MKDQIIETWHVNNRINLKLLDAISDAGLACTLSTRGGRTVALQFAHLHNNRMYRFERHARDLLKGQSKIDPDGTVGRALLTKRLQESADAMAQWIAHGIDNGGKIKGFRLGVVPMLGYLVTHEAHHRGSIILTLKQCGHPVPKETRDGIWGWNQV